MNRTDRPDRQHRADPTIGRGDDPTTDRGDDPTTDRRARGGTMADVSHTHPYADRGALKNVFERGPTIAADGGRREAGPPDDDPEREEATGPDETTDYAADEDADRPRLRDVDHTPPHDGGDGVNRVFERGGAEEPVESEE